MLARPGSRPESAWLTARETAPGSQENSQSVLNPTGKGSGRKIKEPHLHNSSHKKKAQKTRATCTGILV